MQQRGEPYNRCSQLSPTSASRLQPSVSISIQSPEYRYPSAIGSLRADNCRDSLHVLGYARPDKWSWPVPLVNTDIIRTVTSGEMMRILTKRVPR